MGLPLVDTGGTFSWLGTEDVENLPKLTQHRLSSSEVPAPGPAVLSFQGIPGEGRKVADNGCLPNRQVLASYFSVASWSPLFFFWSIRGSCMLPPGVYAAAPATLLPTEF